MRQILVVPFGLIMSALFALTGNYLFSLLIITVFFKVILLPTAISQQKGTSKQVRLQPKLKKIQTKFAGDQRKISEETQALYTREGFNPTSAGCLPLLIQFPIMIGLYEVLYTPLSNVLGMTSASVEALKRAYLLFTGVVKDAAVFDQTPIADIVKQAVSEKLLNNTASRALEIDVLKSFREMAASGSQLVQDLIASAGNITDTIINFNDKFTFMGVYLADSPADYKEVGAKILLIPLLSGLTALMSAVFMYMKQKKNNPEMAKNPSMGCMTFMSPMMSVVFTFMFPAGVGVYWIMTNIITFVQTVVLNYTHSPRKVIAQTMVEETVLRRSRENVIKMRAQMEK